METSTSFRVLTLLVLFTFLTFFNLNAQDEIVDIVESYEDYASDAREVVYIHLNKSTYIKGESIGFTAYVIDKKDKKPSLLTKNLYVSIEDKNQNVIKQKLLKIQGGIASNIIEIDSSFASGHYTIKAYTNWMRNFSEQNYFIESIKVLDPKIEPYVENQSIKNKIDAQFLPEGGHLLNGVSNNIGVVLKDTKGFGIVNAKGSVTDKNDFLVAEFKVNHLGIGRFPLLAELGNSYTITINYLNKEHTFKLNEKVEPIGVTLSIVQHRNKAIVALITNKESLALIKSKPYQLTIHNGDKIVAVDVSFNKEPTIIKVFNLKTMPSGINIFTLFNENNEPVIERLLFNYNGIDIIKSSTVSATKANDSTIIKLNFKHIDTNQLNNLSISVLPQQTKSYNRHHNILSYTYLQPYVKGPLENVKYYFSEISEEKKMELDNLLLTQGWSSYNWNDIFKPNTKLNYPFEEGITLKANITGEIKSPESTYMLHSSSMNQPQFFKVENLEENYFYIDSLFPEQSERLYISTFDKNDIVQPPKIYFQAIPNEIPKLFSLIPNLNPKANYSLVSDLNKNVLQFEKLNNTQELDEVIVNAELDKKNLRLKELSENATGRITIIDDNEIKQHMFLSRFLESKGYIAIDNHISSTLFFASRSQINPTPPLFLNDFPANMHELYMYSMGKIDYIEIDKGVYANGAVRIYTYPGSRREDNRKKKQEFKFPLTFTPKRKFYTPKYTYYNDDFYKGYGTIDWIPNLITDTNGNITLKIPQPAVPIILFIEGIANDGSFIFEEKSISLN